MSGFRLREPQWNTGGLRQAELGLTVFNRVITVFNVRNGRQYYSIWEIDQSLTVTSTFFPQNRVEVSVFSGLIRYFNGGSMASHKATQRKLNKEEKQKRALRSERMASWGLKGALVLLIPLVLIVLWQGLSSGSVSLPPSEVGADDHIKGNPEAAVTLTIYGDFQCPACKAEEQILARAWPRLEDKVQLVFRHYPLDVHRHAFLAARYAEAGALQNKFWELHDVLYANQELWSEVEDAESLFDMYAQEAGLDLVQLKADLALPAIRDKILGDQRGGTRAGVRATPSLFLNGRLLSTNPGSVSELVALVEGAEAQTGGE